MAKQYIINQEFLETLLEVAYTNGAYDAQVKQFKTPEKYSANLIKTHFSAGKYDVVSKESNK